MLKLVLKGCNGVQGVYKCLDMVCKGSKVVLNDAQGCARGEQVV